MQRISGVIVRREYPEDGSIPEQDIQSQFRSLINALATLHSLNVESVGLDEFRRPGATGRDKLRGGTKGYWTPLLLTCQISAKSHSGCRAICLENQKMSL